MITDMARTKGGTPGFKGISVEEAKRRERLAQQRRIEAFEKRKKIKRPAYRKKYMTRSRAAAAKKKKEEKEKRERYERNLKEFERRIAEQRRQHMAQGNSKHPLIRPLPLKF